MPPDTDRLARGLADSVLLVLGSVLAALFGLVGLRLLLTHLSEADYGAYSLFQGAAGVLTVLLVWCVPAVLRLGAEELEAHGTVGRTFASVGALVLALVPVVGLLVLVLRAVAAPTLGPIAWGWALAFAVAAALGGLAASLLQPTGRVGLRTLVPALTRALYALLLLVAASRGALDLGAAMLLCTVTAVPAIVIPLVAVRRELGAVRVDRTTTGRAARFGGPLLLRNLAVQVLLVVNVVVLKAMLGPEDGPIAVARFDVAHRLAEQVVVFGFVLDYLSGPFLAAAAARGERGTLERYVRLAMPQLALLWTLGAGLLVALGEPMLRLLGAHSPAESAAVLELLALAVAIRGVTTLEGPIFDAHLVSGWPTVFLVLAVLVNLGLDVALIAGGAGIMGAAVGTLAAVALHALLRSAYAGRRFGLPCWRPYLGVLPLLVLLVVCRAVDPAAVSPLTRSAVWVAVAAGALVAGRLTGLLAPETREALLPVRMPALARRALDLLYPAPALMPSPAPGPLLADELTSGATGLPVATPRASPPADRRARLLLVITELHAAGAERVVFDLATRLDRGRWRVVVCALTSPGGDDGAVARELIAAGVEVTLLRARGRLDPAAALRFMQLVRALRPHVVHAHLFHASLVARLLGRLAGAPRVITTLHVVERRALPVRLLAERGLARLDDVTVCVSGAVARFAGGLGVPRARVRVVPDGVDLLPLAAALAPGARDDARDALGLPRDALVLGGVGRLTAQKGFDLLLTAFAQLAPRHPQALLVLAGQGEERDALAARARALGLESRVRLLGFRADVPRVLAALDVFCMPSRWEGFGLALVEALAAGRPVVAAAVDSLPEVLGQAGVLVPPGDAPALARALERLLNDPAARAALAAQGPARAASFSVERMLAEHEALYVALLPAHLRDPAPRAPAGRPSRS